MVGWPPVQGKNFNIYGLLYLPIVYVAPSIWNVALLHFLKSFDPRPGILTVRVGLLAVACRMIVAPPSPPSPPFSLWSARSSSNPISPAREALLSLLRLLDWLAIPRDRDVLVEALRVTDFTAPPTLVVAVEVADVTPLALAGVVFTEANNGGDCGLEVTAEDDADENMLVIRPPETAEWAVTVVAVLPGSVFEVSIDDVDCGDCVVTQSRLFELVLLDMLCICPCHCHTKHTVDHWYGITRRKWFMIINLLASSSISHIIDRGERWWKHYFNLHGWITGTGTLIGYSRVSVVQ